MLPPMTNASVASSGTAAAPAFSTPARAGLEAATTRITTTQKAPTPPRRCLMIWSLIAQPCRRPVPVPRQAGRGRLTPAPAAIRGEGPVDRGQAGAEDHEDAAVLQLHDPRLLAADAPQPDLAGPAPPGEALIVGEEADGRRVRPLADVAMI